MSDIFSFKGRIRRTQHGITFLVMAFMSAFFNLVFETKDETILIFLIFYLITTVAYIAAIVRRFHDLGNSGWYTLLLFIPLVGFVYGLILLFKKGTEGPNQYGEDPTVRMMIDDMTSDTVHASSFQSKKSNLSNSDAYGFAKPNPVPVVTLKESISASSKSSKPNVKTDKKEIDSMISLILITMLVGVVIAGGAFFFSLSSKSREDKIVEMNNAIQYFNDGRYDESFNLLSKYSEEEFFTDEAYYSLAYMYGEGLGTLEDNETANQIMIYLSEWEGSDYSSWANLYLGFQHYNGEGADANPVESYNYFIKAARSDVPNAMYQVAVLYHEGDGTKKDLEKAKYWYEKAADLGIEDAINALKGEDFNKRKKYVSISTNSYSEDAENSSEADMNTPDLSNKYEYLNGLEVMTVSGGHLWASENSSSSTKVGFVPKGAIISVINTNTKSSSYFYVEYNGTRGFLSIVNVFD